MLAGCFDVVLDRRERVGDQVELCGVRDALVVQQFDLDEASQRTEEFRGALDRQHRHRARYFVEQLGHLVQSPVIPGRLDERHDGFAHAGEVALRFLHQRVDDLANLDGRKIDRAGDRIDVRRLGLDRVGAESLDVVVERGLDIEQRAGDVEQRAFLGRLATAHDALEDVLLVEDDAEKVLGICKKHGARRVQLAKDAAEKNKLWEARRNALPALARARPTTVLEDATVPRSQIPAMIKAINEIGAKYRLQIGTFGHGFTYSGHPVPAAVAVETLKIYDEMDLVGHVRRMAPAMQEGLRRFADHPLVGEVSVGGFELEYQPGQALREGVVQFAGQALALGTLVALHQNLRRVRQGLLHPVNQGVVGKRFFAEIESAPLDRLDGGADVGMATEEDHRHGLDPGAGQQALEQGCVACLTKPFDVVRLFELIEQHAR